MELFPRPTLISTANLKFGRGVVPKTTLSFDKLLERFTEFIENCYTYGYSLLGVKESAKGKTEHKVPRVKYLAVLSQWSHEQHQLLLAMLCDNTHELLPTKEAHLSFTVTVFVVTQSGSHSEPPAWLNCSVLQASQINSYQAGHSKGIEIPCRSPGQRPELSLGKGSS